MHNKKFYAQKDALGWPIPGTMMSAASEVPEGNIEIPAEDVDSTLKHPDGLRYFVRRTSNGDIIPNSLIISYDKPNGPVYEFKLASTTPAPAPEYLRLSLATLDPESTFSFNIVAGATGPVTFSVDWGDGSPLEPVTIAAEGMTATSHTFSVPNNYEVNLIFSNTSNLNIDAFEVVNTQLLTGISNLSYLADASSLNFSGTAIEVLTLPQSMPNLYSLYLTDCSFLSGVLFDGMAAGSLPSLTVLHCQNANITNINLAATPVLNMLQASGIRVSNTTDIDNIFIALYNNNLTNGYVDLSGGTNAVASEASYAIRTSLMNLSYTLLYNKGLVMTFESAFPVANPQNASSWNTFFGTSVFTSAEVDGLKVVLRGTNKFAASGSKMLSTGLISFDDQLGNITGISGSYFFAANPTLNFVHLASVTAITSASYTFMGSGTDATTVKLRFPVCSNMGGTVGNNSVFSSSFGGKTIALTIKGSLMTNNAAGPDGDIANLIANNTVTVTTV